MSETRALLLTDIVSSTELADRIGDAAAAALWAAHDRLARDLLQLHGGREIDKTDGMLMLFDNADGALRFAAGYHAALARLAPPLQARAGLHVGAVILRSNPPEDVARGAKPLEVEGIAKPVAARVMAIAQGGQTLLTAAARETLGPGTPRLQAHGHWRIKGLADPVELFETGGDDAPFTPPPDAAKAYRVVRRGELWLPLREVRHSLPAERDAFVGRRDALADLARRFDAGARLVSLLGIGGTGKTRLATRFAWTWLGDFPGGAWFCDLSQARNLDGLLHAVALGLDLPLATQDAAAQIGHAIAARGECLVILDNFEQIARHAEDTLGRWLDRASQARFLVTTREVLGLPGEEALALPPLAPIDGEALFMRRAASARRDFRPDADERAAVSQLVRLLDGLPLAIELAAARSRVLSPRALLARMDQRLKLLASAGGRRDRQATLRATFDWSWDLLSDIERSALAQLSVFEGGFTLEAAEAVLDLSPWDGAHWTVDVLQSLVDKSLVRPLEAGRFDLLGSVQDYAAEHLATPERFPGSGAAARHAAAQRHGSYYARLPVQTAGGAAVGAADLDNRIKACRQAVLRDDAVIAIATLAAAWLLLRRRGPYSVGIELAQAVVRMDLRAAQRAQAQFHLGCALGATGQAPEAAEQLRLAQQGAIEGGDERLQAWTALAIGDLMSNQGQSADAMTHYESALAIAHKVAEPETECAALNGLGSASMNLGRLESARTHYDRALQLARGRRDRQWEGALLGNLGVLGWSEGRLTEAMRCYADALAIARELGDRQREGNALCNLGAVHQELGDLSAARVETEAALQLARDIGHLRLESIARCNLGLVELAAGRWQPARDSFEAALDLARRMHDRGSEGQFLGYLGRLLALDGDFDGARGRLEEGERLLRDVGDRLSLGLLLCQRAEAEVLSGRATVAQATMNEAQAIANEAGSGWESELGSALLRVKQLLSGPAGPCQV